MTTGATGPARSGRAVSGLVAVAFLPIGLWWLAQAWGPTGVPLRNWPWLVLTLVAPVLTWGAWPVHRAAATDALDGRLTAACPISLGVLAALARAVDLLVQTPPGAVGPGDGPVLLLGTGCALVLCSAHRYAPAPRRPDGVLVAGVLLTAAAVTGFRLGTAGPHAAADALVAVLLVGGAAAAVTVAVRRPPAVPPRLSVTAHPLPGVAAADLLRHAAALRTAAGSPLPGPRPAVPGVSDLDGTTATGLRGVVSELRSAGPDEPELLFPELARRRGETVVVAHAVLVGPPEWLAAHGVAVPVHPAGGGAGTVTLWVAWDGIARGTVLLVPVVRADAAPAHGRAITAFRRFRDRSPDRGYRRVRWGLPLRGVARTEGPSR